MVYTTHPYASDFDATWLPEHEFDVVCKIGAGYLLSVAVLQAICGKWKLNIGFLMFGYNLAASIISGWMFLGFWNPFIENWKKENYDLTLLYDDPEMKLAQGMQWMYLFFYWTKYIEYADTLWTILKGRLALNPRCCLQVYHHLVAPAIVYLAFYRPSASTCLGGITNSFVHTIMYGYWAGTYLCKEKWFKKLGNNVFYLQMTQFSIILIQNFTIVSIGYYSDLFSEMFIVVQYLIFVVLFLVFFSFRKKEIKKMGKEQVKKEQ